MTLRYVIGDYETASRCDLQKRGAWVYAGDFSTWPLMWGQKVIEGGRPRPTRILLERDIHALDPELMELARDPNVIFVAHNAGFEQAMWLFHMVPLGYPHLPPERWHDTMAVAAMKGLPLGLDAVTAALELPIRKDMEGHRLMLLMCKPDRKGGWSQHTAENISREAEYCTRDVDAQFGLHEALGGLGRSERAIWILDQKINQRGILIDTPFVRSCINVLDQVRRPMEQEFRELTGGLRSSQRAKVLDWVNEQGLPLDNMRRETLDAILDPDDDVGIEEFAEPLPAEVYRVLDLRRQLASSSVSKLERMLQCAGADGRVRYSMQYHGARTGRWAGRLIQIQNYPRGEISSRQGLTAEMLADAIMTRDLDHIREMWGPDIFKAVISSLRSCIIPAPGNILVGGDFAQVEARIVLGLAGQHDKAAMIHSGQDPYAALAEMIYKRPINKKDNPVERQIGKNGLLGSGFGLGPVGFRAKFAPNEPIELAVAAIHTYRHDFAPLVPKLWYGLFEASTAAVWCNQSLTYDFAGIEFRKEGDFLTVRLPSGRKLWYHKPRTERDWNPFRECEVPSWTFMSYQGKKFRRRLMWYGELTNNIVQGIARDLMCHSLHLCEANGLPVIFTAHDENVSEVPERPGLAQLMLQLMTEGVSDLPWVKEHKFLIGAETEEMYRYRK